MQPITENQGPSAPEEQSGPLAGILVVDLTHVLNGPFGTNILSDLGARVIKVEPPGHGDDTRTNGPFVDGQSLYFSFVNRGKESVVLDLKAPADREIFLEMVRRADVLAENFRPGAMDRLGFSYEALAKINPRLIYASSSGFGQTGPLAHFPAYDTIVQGMSGIIDATGFPDGPPTRVGTSIADLCGGVFMFSGIASALYAREKTGRGAHIDIAMLDAMMTFLEHGLMSYVATGRAPLRSGNRHPYTAPFDIFETSDKPVVICCGNDRLFGELCAAIGRPDLAADARFASNVDRVQNNAALEAALESVLETRPAAYWLQVIGDAGVPAGPVLDVAQAAELPQLAARNMIIEAGGVRMPGNPIKISGYPDPKVRPGAPELDQHGAALRGEFAAPPSPSREPGETGKEATR